jgi:integrase
MQSAILPYVCFSHQVLSLSTPPIRRPATHEMTRQVLAEFSEICDTTADVGITAIAAWMACHSDRASLTSFRLLRAFATATRAGKALGLLELDPFSFRKPSGWFATGALDAPETSRHHSLAQISAVLAKASQEADTGSWEAVRLKALVHTYAFTGLRAREALGLTVRDVDLAVGTIHVRPNARRPLKTAASRRKLAVPAALSEVLSDWLPRSGSREWLFPHKQLTGPWFSGRPGHRPLDCVKALGKRAGVEGLTILSLRHSYATAAEIAGLGELGLQRILGHRRPRTQHGYRHEDLDQLRSVAELVKY